MNENLKRLVENLNIDLLSNVKSIIIFGQKYEVNEILDNNNIEKKLIELAEKEIILLHRKCKAEIKEDKLFIVLEPAIKGRFIATKDNKIILETTNKEILD